MVFAVMATGVAKLACCQPEAVSLVKVTCARNVPVLLHRLPTCVPVFVGPLKNRIPVIDPSTFARNFTPSSTAPLSLVAAATAGVVLPGQMVQGQVAASALPTAQTNERHSRENRAARSSVVLEDRDESAKRCVKLMVAVCIGSSPSVREEMRWMNVVLIDA